MTTNTISISSGNRKMGAIPSVSLPACITCNPDAPCFKICYARRLAAFRSTVRNAYQHNLDILNTDPVEYWQQVRAAVAMTRFFRFHVSGDVPTYDYFCEMVKTARFNPHTEILAFTKQYHFVNRWIDENGDLPTNLHILFSLWDPEWNALIPNPHKLPTAGVIFKGESCDGYTKTCGGNCTDCACRNSGCWTLNRGESIGLFEH